MSYRPVVLLDVDGVIADFDSTMAAACAAVGLSPRKCLEGSRLSREEFAMVKPVLYSPGVVERVATLPGAVDGVKVLDAFCNVYFVAAQCLDHETWCYERQSWLVDKFGKELGSKVVFTHHKELVQGDIFVDDKEENCSRWRAAHCFASVVQWRKDLPFTFRAATGWGALAELARYRAQEAAR